MFIRRRKVILKSVANSSHCNSLERPLICRFKMGTTKDVEGIRKGNVTFDVSLSRSCWKIASKESALPVCNYACCVFQDFGKLVDVGWSGKKHVLFPSKNTIKVLRKITGYERDGV